MYLAQSTRKDSSGEALIGLIDGAQAIVMTLLVIEMPVLIIELVEHVKSSEELFFNLTMDIFGYFLAALIIYDIWSIQKGLFQSTKSSPSQNLSCILYVKLGNCKGFYDLRAKNSQFQSIINLRIPLNCTNEQAFKMFYRKSF